ncbi:hypothetical protein EMIHUDRAFT_463854 [Emiliania huxleyi CCMP1516]|uniref:Uncharacterized protein n=2 Tax=Emiliania huxleyi TaxID=2903 RepID=A0A0D3JA73_EMIH1|nr:hypothetical protein EMIHUDRAFT_463854 [Emiliania huxleyi CCMP1516]EOD20408.1 hypothetical protein EMIHUDRAFT_463854 [Emiliania huxleyi CCMP1516]|eukprot:XP_005772837.1 hypothetical protein EMIHUDRAFT_463854 [Emiliania huxleyi CCMP1516]
MSESRPRKRGREGKDEILDGDLIAHATAAAALDARVSAFASYQEALDDGFVADLQKQLMAVFRMGVKLESWLNTYTPPLASGGNVGVSGEVQDGVYAHIHGLSAGCSEAGAALHRMLGYEKEYAVQRTKCTDERTWQRFRGTLEANMLHDLGKTTLQMHADLLNVANSISNNLSHLRTAASEESKLAAMY